MYMKHQSLLVEQKTKEKKIMKVLLTVPHAPCFPSEHRMCDTRALEAAHLLRDELLSQKGFVDQVIIHANTEIPRSQIDMNREISRGTLWRIQLRRILERQSPLI